MEIAIYLVLDHSEYVLEVEIDGHICSITIVLKDISTFNDIVRGNFRMYDKRVSCSEFYAQDLVPLYTFTVSSKAQIAPAIRNLLPEFFI